MKINFLILNLTTTLFLSSMGSALAQNSHLQDNAYKCLSGNCQNDFGTMDYGKNGKYKGNFKNGKKNGIGTYDYANGDVYKGEFTNDKMSGFGTYYFKNGSKYQGQMLDNKFHGKGIYFYNTGNRFDGYWLNGKFDGLGSYYDAKLNKTYTNTYKNGAIVNKPIKLPKLPRKKPTSRPSIKPTKTKGCIQGNCVNGSGTFINEYGDKYVGEFKSKQYHGTGEMITKDGTIYLGGFKNSQFSGQGFYITPSGKHFIGRFNKNLKVGKGILFYSDYSKEVCFYIDDVCQGLATYILKYGNSFQYVYDNGKITNTDQMKKDMLTALKKEKNNYQTGCVWGDCENGLGMTNDEMAMSYTGYFVNGQKSGLGQFRYLSDDIHYGFYANNKKNGIGYTYSFKEEKRFKNLYKNGLIDRKIDTVDIGKK